MSPHSQRPGVTTSGLQRTILVLVFVALIAFGGLVGRQSWTDYVEHGQSTLTARRPSSTFESSPPGAERAVSNPQVASASTADGDGGQVSTVDPRARIWRGADDGLLKVSGPSPRLVLEAFCEADERHLRPADVIPARPADPARRIGILRDGADLSVELALHMRRDRETGRWIAGDGRRSLTTPPFRRSNDAGSTISRSAR